MASFKRLVSKVLCNAYTSNLIRIFSSGGVKDLRWPGYRFTVPKGVAADETVSSIFFGFYEGAEIRFIEQYIDRDTDVIELGASLGIVSSHIVRNLNRQSKFVAIEANEKLLPFTADNIRRHATAGVEWTLLNRAYSAREKELQFEVSSDHTANRRSSGGSMDSKVVPCITLKELIAENRIQKYTLVSDIEGSEIEFLMEEEEALRGCQMMIIELHRGVYEGQQLEVADLRRIIVEKLNFKVVQEHGPVGVYSRI